jgi:hypothetical protein
VLVLQTYSIWVAATVYAYAERLPYVELSRTHGASAKLTILLDYRSLPGPIKIWRSFINKHRLLSSLFFFNLLLTFLVTPFAASLFNVGGDQSSEHDIDVNRTTFYDEYAMNQRTQFLPMLDYARGIKLYNTPTPSWANQLYSFTPFQLPASLSDGTNNVTTEQNATYMSVNCKELVRGTDFTIEDNGNQWTISGDDQGCNFLSRYTHIGSFEFYAQTFSKSDCSSEEPSREGRIFLFAAQAPDRNASEIRHFNLISCASTYYNLTGKLEIGADPSSGSPIIRSFTPGSGPVALENPRPIFWKLFEKTISDLRTDDTAATWSTTLLGRLVIDDVSQNIPIASAFQNASLLSSSLSSTLRLLYSITATTYLRTDISSSLPTPTLHGTLLRRVRYLHAVAPIAYPIAGILLINAFLICLMIASVRSTTSILYEEQGGILASSVLVTNSSDLAETSRRLRAAAPNGRCVEAYARVSPIEYETARWGVTARRSGVDWKIQRMPVP